MDFPLNPNLGSLEIGFLASGFLFGVLTVQALIYNRKFSKDHWALKLLVAVIWFFELGQLGCVAHASYTMTITHSGNPLYILRPPQTIGFSFLVGSAVGPLVEVPSLSNCFIRTLTNEPWQAFYVSRLLRFSGKIYPALVGWVLAFLRFGGWVFLAVHVILMKSLSQWVDDFGWFFAMLLWNQRGHRPHDRGVDSILFGPKTPENSGHGAKRKRATAFGSSHPVDPSNGCNNKYLILGEYLIWMAVLAILTKVSSNCFLASLNARASTRTRGRSNSVGGRSQPHWSQNHGVGSFNNPEQSVVGNIIELYQISEADFQTTHRGGSVGNARSAFSPDGTVISAVSSFRSGYWAL
ncbi:hypothetical protein C8R46DRAFT_1205463 [Mycena filopes]|nr:hypothetical protein C8R46DRAFT_1205463 [Mycena filopes]